MTQKLQSLHWLEKARDAIFAWQQEHNLQSLHVDDMKTPSGRVHTGALRGVVLHDLTARALQEKDPSVISTYVFNDMDPMDSLPGYLPKEEFEQHMGKPLHQIPVPPLEQCGIDLSHASAEEKAELAAARNFGELYALDFMHAFRKLGCRQEIVWSHELYESGQMDGVIRTALDSIDTLRNIYQDVAKYTLPPKWYPFQVICPQCGKVGTTLVTDWDGEQVTFECQPTKVTWAAGCGYQGRVSPFGGTGKLLWKVDWPAHWQVMGVNVEGAGKDHTSAGGSRDMANAIVERVFNNIPPFDLPYEWILIRGTKMSSSKGIGTSAREFVELFPPAVGRFLFVNKHYNQVIDFDPATMAIPDLFDEYDQGARIAWGEEEGDQRLGVSFRYSHLGQVPSAHFLPRFRDVAMWMQYPEINLPEHFAGIKGSNLTEEELKVLAERQGYAQIWLDRYAPADFQFKPTTTVPAAAEKLTDEQKTYLQNIDQLFDQEWEPQALQQKLFDMAKATLGARKGFEAIYLAFLGKQAGPRAAWLLLSLDPEFRHQRIEAVTMTTDSAEIDHIFETLNVPEILSISPQVSETYPSMTLGLAVIKGVNITKSLPELEAAKADLIESLKGLTTDQINEFPEVQSYRQLYREMKIDWHSRRPSPEALLRRVAQGKDLYTVNSCVDAYNLAVMRHRVSVGAFDADSLQLPTQLKIAEGGEQILLLGDSEPTTLKPGEICYFDKTGPYNLDFNYRDAQRTMVTEQTTNLIINVDGVHGISRQQVEITLRETIELIQHYCGGEVTLAGIISAK